MDDKFLVGVVLGMLGGAVLVTNSVKARQAVKSGQEQVIDKMGELKKQQKEVRSELIAKKCGAQILLRSAFLVKTLAYFYKMC